MTHWADDVFKVLVEAGVRQAAYVPDAGHTRLIQRCHAAKRIAAVPLTTEEEGIALLAGAWLGGQRGVLLMQSSGIGNCINMLSLSRACEFPLLMLMTMRGQWREFNPWQLPMGRNAKRILTAAGVACDTVAEPARVAAVVAKAAAGAFGAADRRAVLLHQKLMPRKTFGR
ncbi:MAG: phosphonopyruvate decarboxylase [Rhodospirillales bacterium]|nr:phosphonopyruvate decarboxylase [Rhodospirillales bacterium]